MVLPTQFVSPVMTVTAVPPWLWPPGTAAGYGGYGYGYGYAYPTASSASMAAEPTRPLFIPVNRNLLAINPPSDSVLSKPKQFVASTVKPSAKPSPLSTDTPEAAQNSQTVSDTLNCPVPEHSKKLLYFFKHNLRVGGLLNEIAQAIKPYFRWAYYPLDLLSVVYMTVTAGIAGYHGYNQAKHDPWLPKSDRKWIAMRNGTNEAGFQFIANLFVPPIAIEAANQGLKILLDGGHFHMGKFLHEVQREVFLIQSFRKQTEFLKRWPKGPGIKIKGLYHVSPVFKKLLDGSRQWAQRHERLQSFMNHIKQSALKYDHVPLKHRTALPMTLNGLIIIAFLPKFDRAFNRWLHKHYQPLVGWVFDKLNGEPLGHPIRRHTGKPDE
ncbi:MAG: hypothetical protein KC476_00485 [Cyanobacteria bacterium HKST-UBA06]|nr:hypothetical protein [Cyanobacteria bacterium HKST-UBA06]